MNNNNVSNNVNGEVRKDNGDSKKILAVVVMIAVLIFGTTGATYAYFQISALSNNVVNGTAASASLSLTTPSLIAPTNSTYTGKPMVPQKAWNSSTNVLQKAFNGATGKDKCVDGNNNVICKAYQFTVTNNSTATAVIKGQLKFDWGASNSAANWFENLKWKLMDSSTAVTISGSALGTTATKSWANIESNLSLSPGGSKTYYIIIWIEETGSAQNNTDKGSWLASIQFVNNTDNSGITSTITS